MPYTDIREEELKNKVAQDYFVGYDCTKIMGNIDFCVSLKLKKHKKQEELFEDESLLWAEAKAGIKADIYKSFAQLILTIGKARTFDKKLPPAYLGAFDGEKIAFIPYNNIQEIFYQNDFNWKVTPSDHETKEFKQVYNTAKTTIETSSLLFKFDRDDKELREFIKKNFIVGKARTSKIKIDKNNFTVIYNKWIYVVKPTIVIDWVIAKKNGIIDGDFYLADLLSRENETIKEKLFILLKIDHYVMDRKFDEMGFFSEKTTTFTDEQKAHKQFWNKYERPPKEEYWDYIVERRDLLVPQDVRERKGSFFTPQIWVELSQKYITDVLGENWQDEYYIWDCAAGTGNLLAGLTYKYNIWASTLDKQDVDVMKDRIKNGANLLEDHVFQFDFLNDEFENLPKGLQEIINNSDKREKLIIYINPPYAEADSRKGDGRKGVAASKIHDKYSDKMGYTKREIYIQFLTRIYFEINGCWLADFSKLKNLQAPKFIDFRKFFRAELKKCFIVPAKTFDNVKGSFPIGFKIWDTSNEEEFYHISADVYDEKSEYLGIKDLWAYGKGNLINDWVKTYRKTDSDSIATIIGVGSDFQNQRLVRLGEPHMDVPAKNHNWQITKDNLIESSIYYTVRKIIEATWINDRDQFLYPNNGWTKDKEFQNDCLTYLLFKNGNKSSFGINNWIPFTENEVNSRDKFESNFMTDFIAGKLTEKPQLMIFDKEISSGLHFSPEAISVFDAGRELWIYYHSQQDCNVNASLYNIREHFQGRNENGKMNNTSDDGTYMSHIKKLREQLNVLAKKIKPKVYEYGFLKG